MSVYVMLMKFFFIVRSLTSNSSLWLLQIGGIAFVAIGGLILAKAGDIENVLKEHNTYSVPIGLIVVGSVIFVIAFFGCCGAVRESQCMTMTVSTYLCLSKIALLTLFYYLIPVRLLPFLFDCFASGHCLRHLHIPRWLQKRIRKGSSWFVRKFQWKPWSCWYITKSCKYLSGTLKEECLKKLLLFNSWNAVELKDPVTGL